MTGFGRRIRRAAVAAAALTLVCAVALASLSYPFMTVTTDTVRLRQTASTNGVVLTEVPGGDAVEVLGETGNYYKVKYDTHTGYIQKQFIDTDPNVITTNAPSAGEKQQEQETVSGYPYNTVTLESVNLRERQSVRSTLLKKIPAGAEITVHSSGSTWSEITYNGRTGYAMNDYLSLKKVVKVKETPTPTPVPTLSPEEDAGGYVILQKGDSGNEVKALQLALIEMGYLNGTADGNFGAATENAVIQFQNRNGYPTTGIVDANLQAFIYSGTPKNALGQEKKVNTLSPAAGASIKLGNVGEEVGRVQARLLELGYYKGSVTNTYDAATKNAVSAFQKKNGLKADGIVGAETKKALFESGAKGPNDTPTPEPIPTATPQPTYTLPENTVKKGSEGWEAKEVQRRLYDLGYLKVKPDGKFGDQSVRALKAFQSDNGLKADGVAGVATCEALFDPNALKVGTTATPVPAVVTPTPVVNVITAAPSSSTTWQTIRPGDGGDDVAQLQEALIELGYLTGKADGNYGSKTTAAVKAFQKANGLTVDGVAGADTQKVLFGGSAKRNGSTATPTPAPSQEKATTLRKGSKGTEVVNLQKKLISLGYLTGSADGVYGTNTYDAVMAFQKANKLSADGVAGSQTQAVLSSSSAVPNSSSGKAAPSTTPAPKTPSKPSAALVQYANWYTTVKAICKRFPYATVYDIGTGISWQVHIFSLGAHADYEPLTAADTAKMLKVFGGNTWNPKAVWVVFGDGSVYLGSTHSKPHGVQHRTDNNFAGHSCLHFPRTQEQVTAIGTYATSHQECIDKAWAQTQKMK